MDTLKFLIRIIKWMSITLVLLNSRASVDDVKAGDTVGIVIAMDNVFHRGLSISILSISSDKVEQGMAGSSGEAEQRKVVKIYGIRTGKDNWTEVDLSKATYLGAEVMAIPGAGKYG